MLGGKPHAKISEAKDLDAPQEKLDGFSKEFGLKALEAATGETKETKKFRKRIAQTPRKEIAAAAFSALKTRIVDARD